MWRMKRDLTIATSVAVTAVICAAGFAGATQAMASARGAEATTLVGRLGQPDAPPASASNLGHSLTTPSSVRAVAQIGDAKYWALADGPMVCLLVEVGTFSASSCETAAEFLDSGVSLATSGTMAPETEAYLIPPDVQTDAKVDGWTVTGDVAVPDREDAGVYSQRNDANNEFIIERLPAK